jgi:hypothetical protein
MLACGVLLVVPCANAANQDKAASDNQTLTEQFGPFTFSAGQSSNGGLAANLDGQGRKSWQTLGSKGHEQEDITKNWLYAFSYLGYAVNGTWGTAQDAANNASVSLKPGVDGMASYGSFHDPSKTAPKPFNCDFAKPVPCLDANGKLIPAATYPNAYLGFGTYGDAELRYGSVNQNGKRVNVREFMVGGGVYFALPHRWDTGFVRSLASPRLSATYYHPTNTTDSSNIPLPDGVKANYLQSELRTVLGFGTSGNNYVKLDVKYDGSKANTGTERRWQSLWTAKLWVPKLSFNGVNPSITYQSGANGGFTYDRQVLLGVLVEFLDPKSPSG